jgi:hypothetical protein
MENDDRDDDEFADDIVKALLADQEMEQLQSYLTRGRPLDDIDVDDLHHIWVDNYKAFFVDGDQNKLQAFSDADTELRLRKLPQPHHLVRQYWEAVRRRVEAAVHQNRDTIEDSIRQDLEAWLKKTAN